jgi:cytochrome c5
VSKQDTHFFNVFSLVIGILVVVAILLFALARSVAGHTQAQQVFVERDYVKAVNERLQPLSKEAVAGQDNSALAIVEKSANAGGSATAAAAPANGDEAFTQVCSACHGAGIAGAPKAGDKAAWQPRVAKGKDVLYQHALQGFTGSSGMMPAKGGRPDLSDDVVKQAVDHMLELAK